MRDFQILTDSVADLPASWVKAHPYVTVVDTPINVTTVDNQQLTLHNLTADDFEQVEQYIKQGGRAMTSQPSVFDPDEENPSSVESLTKHYLREGKDVIYITMAGTMSGTFNTVTLCYRELDDFATEQGRRLLCVDSHCMSTGLALLFIEIDKAIQRGEIDSIEKVADYVGANRGFMGHFFTWAKLDYVKLSGRVSSVQSMMANLFHLRLICSAQYVNEYTRKLEHINPHAKQLIGIKSWANALGIYAQRHIVDPCGEVIVAHGNVPRDARMVVEKLREYLPDAKFLTGPEWRCGAGIQVHGGPTSIHVNFRTDIIGKLKETTEEMEDIIRGLRIGV